jgi:biopolymer transport protein ExbD
LQGKAIILVKDALDSNQKTIRPLFDALRRASASVKEITDKNGVTIMGDREIPYGLLKKIMLTCAGAQYTNISFAVTQKAPDS